MSILGKLTWLQVVFAMVALLDGHLAAAEVADSTNTLVVTNIGPSPVQVFRHLLTLDSRSRADELSLRPPGMREPIEAKVNEYLALPADEREARLQATELRHYLTLLLPLTNRLTLVRQIAEPMRSVVLARLEKWEIMLPQMREEVIANEQVVGYFTQLGKMTLAQRNQLLSSTPSDQLIKLEQDIKRWRDLPEAEQKRSLDEFNKIFSLSTEEREKTLSYLSDTERDAMEATLQTFAGLTFEQRKTCVLSFQKFTNMTLAERQEFLKKAEAWQRMTPAEREQWREVVQAVPQLPPLPPGFFPTAATSRTPPTAKTNSVPVMKMTNGG